jgi:hypothetical protein
MKQNQLFIMKITETLRVVLEVNAIFIGKSDFLTLSLEELIENKWAVKKIMPINLWGVREVLDEE